MVPKVYATCGVMCLILRIWYGTESRFINIDCLNMSNVIWFHLHVCVCVLRIPSLDNPRVRVCVSCCELFWFRILFKFQFCLALVCCSDYIFTYLWPPFFKIFIYFDRNSSIYIRKDSSIRFSSGAKWKRWTQIESLKCTNFLPK